MEGPQGEWKPVWSNNVIIGVDIDIRTITLETIHGPVSCRECSLGCSRAIFIDCGRNWWQCTIAHPESPFCSLMCICQFPFLPLGSELKTKTWNKVFLQQTTMHAICQHMQLQLKQLSGTQTDLPVQLFCVKCQSSAHRQLHSVTQPAWLLYVTPLLQGLYPTDTKQRQNIAWITNKRKWCYSPGSLISFNSLFPLYCCPWPIFSCVTWFISEGNRYKGFRSPVTNPTANADHRSPQTSFAPCLQLIISIKAEANPAFMLPKLSPQVYRNLTLSMHLSPVY